MPTILIWEGVMTWSISRTSARAVGSASALPRASSRSMVDRLIELYGLESVPLDAAQVVLAREGMLAYGEGRGAAPQP